MYVYITDRNSLNSTESQDNVYDIMPHISTKKSVVAIYGSAYLQIKNPCLFIHICALVNWYWKCWKISSSFSLNYPLLEKSVVDDGVSAILVTARGCPAAVVRLWHTIDGPPVELCGEKQSTDRWQYLSEDNSMKIR